jgi:hypothetical protein
LMVSLLASNSTSLQRTLVDLDLIDLMPNVTSSLARRALLRHGFLSIHARLHVGIRGKSGLALLNESPSHLTQNEPRVALA